MKPLTSQQFAVIEVLSRHSSKGPMSGRDLRKQLAARGAKRTAPAFYQLMARMEDAGLVTGDYRSINVNRTVARERVYVVQAKGVEALNTTRTAYTGRDHDGVEQSLA